MNNIDKRETIMFCDKCGAENRDGAEYCANCGGKLSSVRTPLPGDVKTVAVGEASSPVGFDYLERFKQAVADRYIIIRELGRGGMAIVFLARDTRLDRKVALKLLPQEISRDTNFTERFMREARISAKLSHPNIIQIHDVDSVGGFTYYSMSFIDGISLAQIIKKGGAINSKILSRLGIQICFAIQHAHENGVIHRDIKPENILINKQRMPIVVDFGIARAKSDARLSTTGMFIGTPQYMSPEQIKGAEIDHRSDIYSLGGVLYEMATGRPAFRAADTAALMYKQVHENPVPPHEINRNISAGLSAVIMKALAKNPDDRPQSAKDLGRLLHELSQSEPDVPVSLSPVGGEVSVSDKQAGISADIDNTADPDSATILMAGAPPRKQEKIQDIDQEQGQAPVNDAAPDGTLAMKRTEKKPPAPKKEDREKKKGLPAFVNGLIIFGILGITALGVLSLFDKSGHDAVMPPPRQADTAQRQESGTPAQPPAEPDDVPPPVVERKEPVRRELARQDAPPQEPLRPAIPVRTPEREIALPPDAAPSPVDAQIPVARTSPTEETLRSLSETAPSPSVREPSPVQRPAPRQETPVTAQPRTEEPAAVTPDDRIAARVVPESPAPSIPTPSAPQRAAEPPSGQTAAIRWVRIPGGTFEMGDFVGDLREELLCRPVHRATVSPFEMSQTEVTVEQYAAFVRDTGRSEPLQWQEQLLQAQRPVIFVSWNDAVAFAQWAGARLPTEAEWEFAACGGASGQRYPWGNDPPEGRANLGRPWDNGNGWKTYLQRPGMYPPNTLGLYDMAGNVWEWTADLFGPYQAGLAVNPTGPASGNLRVMRGGAWNSTESFIRNAIRGPSSPDKKDAHIGFRIVRNANR